MAHIIFTMMWWPAGFERKHTLCQGHNSTNSLSPMLVLAAPHVVSPSPLPEALSHSVCWMLFSDSPPLTLTPQQVQVKNKSQNVITYTRGLCWYIQSAHLCPFYSTFPTELYYIILCIIIYIFYIQQKISL